MCAILTVFNSKWTDLDLLQSLKLMSHRGPDASSHISSDGYWMGHNRLAIIDLNPRSNQPFEIGDHVIVFNGEIYNYLELREKYRLQCETESDTEVLLRLYMQMGEACLAELNGMFAFVIYNKRTKEVFVARDRLGIKPLYVYKRGEVLIYSSEIAPIHKLTSLTVNEFAVRQYRKMRMTFFSDTFFEEVEMFPAGHWQLGERRTRYWTLEPDPSETIDLEEIEMLFMDAVSLRKRSDVPVGSYLSGGLDSTILSLLLDPDQTYTVGFESCNEFEWGSLAASFLGGEHIQVPVDRSEFLDATRELIDARKEPLSVPNESLLYLMTRRVKKENTVVLSGEGADELFWGYDRIFRACYQENKMDVDFMNTHYSYGTDRDDEVIDYAISSLPGDTALARLGYFFQIRHLHGLLRRVDNSTMRCAVEARVPFVDHRLVELMGNASYEFRNLNGQIKGPLKEIASRCGVSEKIINRPKIGFPVPLEEVFGGGYDEWFSYNLKTWRDEIEK